MNIKTLQQEWKEYRDAIYPNGISGIQNRETHQAFFSGALVVCKILNEIGKMPEAQGVLELEKITKEAMEVTSSIAGAMKARN